MTQTNYVLETYTGIVFDLLNPTEDMICLEDISVALSRQNRFNGHSMRSYSVAEHSLNVMAFCEPKDRFWGLMHDAAEAYTGDIPRPMKTDEMRAMEDDILKVIARKFGLSWPIPDEVMRVDDRMLATEARDIMRSGGSWWTFKAEPYANLRIRSYIEFPVYAIQRQFENAVGIYT